ncbi:MAG TPA: hypothetical protein VIY52_18325 [Streptosporangiaceae bacterium]
MATGLIPFWWDMLIVAASSLIIYHWAQAVRLAREQMMMLVERQASVHGEAAPATGVP